MMLGHSETKAVGPAVSPVRGLDTAHSNHNTHGCVGVMDQPYRNSTCAIYMHMHNHVHKLIIEFKRPTYI